MTSGKDKIELEGCVIEKLPNTMFIVKLDAGGKILTHLSGKMRLRYIRITTRDRVRIEVSKYDPKRGIITYRLGRNKT